MSKKKQKKGVVYSTNPNFTFDYDGEKAVETLAPNQQNLKVCLEKKHRGGKTVVLIKDFIGSADDLQLLGKILKTKCGTGGSAKDGEIIIQGDCRDKVMLILEKEGYKYKRVGG